METPIISAIIAGCVAIVIFNAGQILSARAGRRERRRATLKAWQERLTEWVDEHGHPEGEAPHNHGKLANRQETELSLQKEDQLIAWWMYEVAAELVELRSRSKRSFLDKQNTVHNIGHSARAIGNDLISWHHGRLKREDFCIPQKIRQIAREYGYDDPYRLARGMGLLAYMRPVRLNFLEKFHLSGILLNKDGVVFRTALNRSLQRKMMFYFALRAILMGFPFAIRNEFYRRIDAHRVPKHRFMKLEQKVCNWIITKAKGRQGGGVTVTAEDSASE